MPGSKATMVAADGCSPSATCQSEGTLNTASAKRATNAADIHTMTPERTKTPTASEGVAERPLGT
jgi:hypothetical protein